MISLPLFGQDSSPHKTSMIISLMATGGVWVILLLCFIFIPVRTKVTRYKPVQIILDSTPMDLPPVENPVEPVEAEETVEADSTEIIEEAVTETVDPVIEQPVPVIEEALPEIPEVEAPVQQPVQEQKKEAPKVVETPKSVAKPVETPKPTPKPETVKSDAAPAKPAENVAITKENTAPLYEIQKSVDDQLDFASVKKNTANYDDVFAAMDKTSANTTSSTSTKKVNTQSSVSGSSAEMASTKPAETVKKTTEAAPATSDKTSEMLNKISSTPSKTYTSKKATNNNSSTTMNSKNSVDGIQVEMQGGKLRTLLEPMTTAIPISDAAGNTITEDKEVVITFTVGKNGDVPRSEIKITPSAILSSQVIEEILNTMTTWRFETSDTVSTGSFKFTIIKK